MKYIKTYENLEEPQIGDFVVINVSHITNFKDFIENNVGKIIKTDAHINWPYEIQYDIIKKSIITSRKEILYFSKNKEDCEAYLASKKYNL